MNEAIYRIEQEIKLNEDLIQHYEAKNETGAFADLIEYIRNERDGLMMALNILKEEKVSALFNA